MEGQRTHLKSDGQRQVPRVSSDRNRVLARGDRPGGSVDVVDRQVFGSDREREGLGLANIVSLLAEASQAADRLVGDGRRVGDVLGEDGGKQGQARRQGDLRERKKLTT